ncbi:MAG TPA: hypothetical protein VFI68_14130 [Anaerolineales bacterium]|nr:hypothetical protein [Anaerolineales bacterium]
MGEKLSPQQFELYQGIDQILWEDWDPIGVNEYENTKDEYHSYLPVVFRLTLDNANELQIAEYLYKCITENIGLASSIKSNINVAKKIVQLKTKIDP